MEYSAGEIAYRDQLMAEIRDILEELGAGIEE